MMHSRVALSFLGSSPRSLGRQLRRSWCRAATINTTAAGAGDPAVHAEMPQGDDQDAEQQRRERLVRREGGGEREPPLQPTIGSSSRKPSSSTFATGPKLESSEVPPPVEPAFQQKRKLRCPDEPALGDVSCVGWDGRPLRGGEEGRWEERRREEEQTEDYREYFAHHKPTPLSELEFADTRRPIRRATDSDVVDDDAGVAGEPRVGWREEQQDTVDEALLRAEVMFRAAAERGDPDTPHGRVLANYQRLVLL